MDDIQSMLNAQRDFKVKVETLAWKLADARRECMKCGRSLCRYELICMRCPLFRVALSREQPQPSNGKREGGAS